MKKILCVFLTAVLLMGLLSACKLIWKNDAAISTGDGWEEDIFDSEPTVNTQPQNQETVAPTQGQQAATQPTEGQQTPTTQPTESTPPVVTTPTEPSTESTTPSKDPLVAEYEAYLAMSYAQKKAYRKTFSDYDAFFAWYNAALKAYNDANPPTQIGPDGVIELG